MKLKRATAFALIFWTTAMAFIAFDWSAAKPYNRFDEPPPWQLGQDKVEGSGHCAMPLNALSPGPQR